MENIFLSANKFQEVALNSQHPNWDIACKRVKEEAQKSDEIRSSFDRDANRILHSSSYSRLKDKTQVFFHADNDRICTRIEHVNHVSSVSSTIARFLGLNGELTSAISLGHDLGHAPFGHSGEQILNDILNALLPNSAAGINNLYSNDFLEQIKNQTPTANSTQPKKQKLFWHEQNSLNTVDDLALLQDTLGNSVNLNLTYAVRDGIISHCGEVSDVALKPRLEAIDLTTITRPNQYSPYTWEACVVKVSDKISYLGRDIEDAVKLSILTQAQLKELSKISSKGKGETIINNTVLIHSLIIDLCKNSSVEKGISFTPEYAEIMSNVIAFNYKYIYKHKRLKNYEAYAKLVITSIYEFLYDAYKGEDTVDYIKADLLAIFPILSRDFMQWLNTYSLPSKTKDIANNSTNITESIDDLIPSLPHKKLYNLAEKNHYIKAITDFMASLTDRGIISYFDELMRFP